MRGRGISLLIGMKAGAAKAEQKAEMQQQMQQVQKQAAQAAAAAPSKDVYAELQKLGDLHKSGILSDEEFATAKKKLLEG